MASAVIGRYAVQGPDFEGQTRRLRSADGVHFTKAGAVKLASYVDRELRRVTPNNTVRVSGLLQKPPHARACYVLAHGESPFVQRFPADAERMIQTLVWSRAVAVLRY